jgi:hypothetical protein
MHLDVLQDCKIVSTNELEKLFQPLGSIAGSIYRVSCTKSIYVHLHKFTFYLIRIRKSLLKMAFRGPVLYVDSIKLSLGESSCIVIIILIVTSFLASPLAM